MEQEPLQAAGSIEELNNVDNVIASVMALDTRICVLSTIASKHIEDYNCFGEQQGA